MRLDKFLAEASVGTRKKVRNYVKEGKVTVNNHIVLEPAADIDETTDAVRYLDTKVIHARKIYYMFHKPEGCITARKDANSKTILDYFNDENMNGIFPVGRLDKDTEGLLFLTNDGEFNHRLMFPEKHVEKTYFFWAYGSLDYETMERLKTGIDIGDNKGLVRAINVEVDEEGKYEELKDKMNRVNSIEINKNPYQQLVLSGYLTISEGRKHQVKRMLKAVGCYVVYLKRVSIGGLILDETLNKGHYRELTEQEISALYDSL